MYVIQHRRVLFHSFRSDYSWHGNGLLERGFPPDRWQVNNSMVVMDQETSKRFLYAKKEDKYKVCFRSVVPTGVYSR